MSESQSDTVNYQVHLARVNLTVKQPNAIQRRPEFYLFSLFKLLELQPIHRFVKRFKA